MALEKTQKQLIITGIMILVLVFVSMNSIKETKRRATKTKEPDAQAQVVTQGQAQPSSGDKSATGGFAPVDKKILDLQISKVSSSEPLKDPFYPASLSASYKKGSLTLMGISWMENGVSFALINEEIVRVGDTVANSEVIEINKKSVVLEKDGQRYILVLEE